MNAQEMRERAGGAWQARPDGWWRQAGLHQVRAVAREMREGGARFAALTVRPDGGSMKLTWHWDMAGTLLSIEALMDPAEAIPSVVDIWPGAFAECASKRVSAIVNSLRTASALSSSICESKDRTCRSSDSDDFRA